MRLSRNLQITDQLFIVLRAIIKQLLDLVYGFLHLKCIIKQIELINKIINLNCLA